MNVGITNFWDLGIYAPSAGGSSDNGEFSGILDSILSENVLISPKYEKQLIGNSELSEELVERIRELGSDQNSVVIVNRRGEISRYNFSEKKEPEHPTAEELRDFARARARKKARLDAYFHLLERVSIKRKLIEQENAMRFFNKKYRRSASLLDAAARSRQITSPPPVSSSDFLW